MEGNQAGVTALITAYARAYHAAHDNPKIFDDFLAERLFTPEEQAFFGQALAGLLPLIDPDLAASHPDQERALALVMQLYSGPITLSRSRFAEDSLDEAISEGAQQVVILGAGMDTIAYRRPELSAQMHIFEVDHPVTQALKRQRFSTAGWEQPSQLHFIPMDFAKDYIAAALQQASYDPEKRSFFCWQGVTYYLSRDILLATFKEIASISTRGSMMVFDYLDEDAFIPEKAEHRIQLMQGITRQTGEPMITGFDPCRLSGLLESLGFSLQENLAPADIQAHYFAGRTDRYRAMEHVHFAKAIVI